MFFGKLNLQHVSTIELFRIHKELKLVMLSVAKKLAKYIVHQWDEQFTK
jgi:hypothetical protein